MVRFALLLVLTVGMFACRVLAKLQPGHAAYWSSISFDDCQDVARRALEAEGYTIEAKVVTSRADPYGFLQLSELPATDVIIPTPISLP